MIIGNSLGGGGGAFANINVYGLQQTDSVVATKGSKTKNGVWKSVPNPEYVVPSGYTQLTYIQSSGTQKISTGKIARTDFDYVEYKITYTQNREYQDFGNFDSYIIRRESSGNKFVIYVKNSSNNWSTLSTPENSCIIGTEYTFKITFSNSNTVFNINGTDYTITATPYSTINPEWVLFAGNAENVMGYYQLRYFKGKKNGEDVFDFIPTKNSSNVAGMYDVVGNSFYSNEGTGTFVEGNEVPQYINSFQISHISDLGTWTVTATSGSQSKSISVLVDVITDYDIEWAWRTYLYNLGDECESLTGGWEPNTYKWSSTQAIVSAVKNTNSISVGTSVTPRSSFAGTSIKVDLTDYSEIHVNVTSISGDCLVSASSVKQPMLDDSTKLITVFSTIGDNYVDVSSLSGEYYVSVGYLTSSTYPSFSAVFNKVWLE